jgi:hypothetical protein
MEYPHSGMHLDDVAKCEKGSKENTKSETTEERSQSASFPTFTVTEACVVDQFL